MFKQRVHRDDSKNDVLQYLEIRFDQPEPKLRVRGVPVPVKVDQNVMHFSKHIDSKNDQR
jgi:hypothetical protein